MDEDGRLTAARVLQVTLALVSDHASIPPNAPRGLGGGLRTRGMRVIRAIRLEAEWFHVTGEFEIAAPDALTVTRCRYRAFPIDRTGR